LLPKNEPHLLCLPYLRRLFFSSNFSFLSYFLFTVKSFFPLLLIFLLYFPVPYFYSIFSSPTRKNFRSNRTAHSLVHVCMHILTCADCIACSSLLYSFTFLDILMWVPTCNVTAYRNAVTLQVTDTIRSYDLNFHPVPHDVTVSCERYTVGFPVCYGSQKARGADGGGVSRCTS
jgi:hypothetical protein